MTGRTDEQMAAAEIVETRRYQRIPLSFRVLIWKELAGGGFGGRSLNVSQLGAFVKTEEWHRFRVGDQAVLLWLLPAEFTGQDETISLKGEAVIRRVDGERRGIAVEFSRPFKTFERVYAPS